MHRHSFSGIWRSHYRYPSRSRGGEFDGEHYVEIFQRGNKLVVEAVPGANKSYLILNLLVDGNIATGTWQETTAPDGHYKGAVYHGAIQLAIDRADHSMTGKWVGFGKDMQINSGLWELQYIGKELPQT